MKFLTYLMTVFTLISSLESSGVKKQSPPETRQRWTPGALEVLRRATSVVVKAGHVVSAIRDGDLGALIPSRQTPFAPPIATSHTSPNAAAISLPLPQIPPEFLNAVESLKSPEPTMNITDMIALLNGIKKGFIQLINENMTQPQEDGSILLRGLMSLERDQNSIEVIFSLKQKKPSEEFADHSPYFLPHISSYIIVKQKGSPICIKHIIDPRDPNNNQAIAEKNKHLLSPLSANLLNQDFQNRLASIAKNSASRLEDIQRVLGEQGWMLKHNDQQNQNEFHFSLTNLNTPYKFEVIARNLNDQQLEVKILWLESDTAIPVIVYSSEQTLTPGLNISEYLWRIFFIDLIKEIRFGFSGPADAFFDLGCKSFYDKYFKASTESNNLLAQLPPQTNVKDNRKPWKHWLVKGLAASTAAGAVLSWKHDDKKAAAIMAVSSAATLVKLQQLQQRDSIEQRRIETELKNEDRLYADLCSTNNYFDVRNLNDLNPFVKDTFDYNFQHINTTNGSPTLHLKVVMFRDLLIRVCYVAYPGDTMSILSNSDYLTIEKAGKITVKYMSDGRRSDLASSQKNRRPTLYVPFYMGEWTNRTFYQQHNNLWTESPLANFKTLEVQLYNPLSPYSFSLRLTPEQNNNTATYQVLWLPLPGEAPIIIKDQSLTNVSLGPEHLKDLANQILSDHLFSFARTAENISPDREPEG